MWDSSPVDQADEYGRNLLARKRFTDVEKFNLLRGISMTVAGIKANGKTRTSREELENLILGYYHERLVLDLDKHSDGIAANFTVEIMKRRVLGANEKLSKRKEEAIEKAEIKADKKKPLQLIQRIFSCYFLKEEQNPKKTSVNSPSNVRTMPDDFLPTHFLSWLANGPAADDQHPLWLPDTGRAVITQKVDILDCPASSTSLGRSSAHSRKPQRSDKTQSSESSVLDLTQGDEVSNGLLRESVKNSSQIVSLLKGALMLNAHRMYELDSNSANKSDYIKALQRQKNLLEQRSANFSAVKEETKEFDDIQLHDDFIDDALFDGKHSLDDSFSHETFEKETPTRL